MPKGSTNQKQKRQPGRQNKMRPQPKSDDYKYRGSGKLLDKVAIITGGDSGIGRAVAVFYAKEGADIACMYYDEHEDAKETQRLVEQEGRKCILIAGDVGKEAFCKKAVAKTKQALGKIDILVNNAAVQFPKESITEIDEKQLDKTFRTNIYSYFFMTKAVMPHFKKGGVIINTASVTAFRGSEHLLDYSSTKGAIVAFTRSLSLAVIDKGIRVNGVAPGPIWTPLIAATFSPAKMRKFGKNTPMKRPGQPEEVAPSYVFLASDDGSYFSGQILHPNGGEIINT
ncbi:MAG: SDR family oxidoreductase [Chlamydiales bacterium]|nr:SDR family oxidoreductase [Chlamydiales bacterium]